MLDLEIIDAGSLDGTDIVGLPEMKRHLRIKGTQSDADITACIIEAADKMHGRDGELNRTIFPTTYRMYLSNYPDLVVGTRIYSRAGIIRLPYPPLIAVTSINTEDGASPPTAVDAATYVVKTGTLVPEIHLKAGETWPQIDRTPRAASITFTAGYADSAYPPKLKRLIKIMAAHYFENIEATINEPRQMMVNRQISFGVQDLRAALRIPLSYENWDC